VKKLAAGLALVLACFGVAPGWVTSANAADDDPYTAGVRTSCHIAVPAVVRVGQTPRIRVTIRPNAPADAASARAEQPTGTVDVSITRAGTSSFSRTVDYNGSTVTVVGPRITQPGHYVVRAQFHTDDGSTFKSCHNNTAFDVRTGGSPDDIPPDGGTDNPDGLLPDTGGPNLLWLILGLMLVGSGGGLVYAAKRRPSGPLYDV
jgi:LPXTG-motif cell wall-anchored protein